MNILLTGSGGFIGSNLKQYLQNKYYLLSPRSYELDLCNAVAVNKYFNENKIDFIIHCATVGGVRGVKDSSSTVDDNLAMMNNLINAKNPRTRMIVFGSGAMYDRSRDLHKVKESEIGEHTPQDLYGLSKMKIAQIVASRDDITCLNIFACYGYGEKENRFPSYAVMQNLHHKPVIINQDVIFDYLFVEDMVKIVEHFIINKPTDKIINITPTVSISLSEIATMINRISDFNSEIIIKNTKMNFEYTGDNSLLLTNIADFEFTSMNDGLRRLYNFIKNTVKMEIHSV